MKKPNLTNGMRPGYNFAAMKTGIRGKYVNRYRKGTNIVLLKPDIAEAFPNDKAVHQTLRDILNITGGTRTGRLANKSERPATQRRPRSKRG
jgi:hypothetical protein